MVSPHFRRILRMQTFVYCWTDKGTNKLYIGSHKGSENDGYICSSKYMMEEYNQRPQDFSRQIIAHGTEIECRKLESAILTSCNAALSEEFYNRHNNNVVPFYNTKEKSAEQKLAMAKSAKIRANSPEGKVHLRSIAGNQLGIKKPEGFGENIGLNNSKGINGFKGRKHTTESIEKMIKSRTGQKRSDETKKRMSEAQYKRNLIKTNGGMGL